MVCQIIGILVILGLFGYYIAYPLTEDLIAYGFTWQIELPLQTRAVVFLEYVIPGVILFFQKKYVTSLLGLVFPIYYLRAENEVMRLHHSFTGLVLLCIPSWPVQYLGTCIVLDSAMYMIVPDRSIYDIMNVIVDFAPMLSIVYSVSIVFAHWRPERLSFS